MCARPALAGNAESTVYAGLLGCHYTANACVSVLVVNVRHGSHVSMYGVCVCMVCMCVCHAADFNLLDLQCTGDASESGLVKCVQAINDVKEAR